ncbi:putative AT hook domain-containing protein [Rosellinia necatrix]|uniref:Sister chromatid cohesion protein n=1 Tax=Rosellinia necatrix TaxID=77044 RepID=A0A1W2TFM6_ROSNE|nr:putative AT hook domain-containing protein [Rosellinia necatrix]
MAHPQHFHQNGVSPHRLQQQQQQQQQQRVHHNQNQHQHQRQFPAVQSHDQQPRTRPFSLEEALPYTPFTSVFPFDSDILSNPSIGVEPFAPSLANFVSRDDYDALNHEAENSNQSKRLDSSLEYVQNLLKPEKITKFEFKTAPKTAPAPNSSVKALIDGISPFARMVYDSTSLVFGYHSPNGSTNTPNGPSMLPASTKKSPNPRKPDVPKVIKHNPATINAQAVTHNKSRIEVHIPTQRQREVVSTIPIPQPASIVPPPPAQSQPQTVSLADLMVRPQVSPVPVPKIERGLVITQPQVIPQAPQAVIPPRNPSIIQPAQKQETPEKPLIPPPQSLSPSVSSSQKQAEIRVELPKATFNREEFAVVPDSPEAPADLSTKRDDSAMNDPLTADLNQRDRANIIFSELRRCLQEIFIAEDQLSSQQVQSSPYIYLTADQEFTMTSSAHDKAQRLLKRAIEVGCFAQVPFDGLIRLQNLSEGSLKYADSLDFKINEEWGETEVGLLVQQISHIDRGLKAARTALRVMCGGREEKQLYSEDLIQLGLNLFRNVMEGIIVPIAEVRSTGPTAALFRSLVAHKKSIMTLFASSQKLFALMSDLITSIDLSETVVNTLEFMSSRLMFVENAYTEKDSVPGVSKFDGLRLVAMHMLSQIFLMNPAQREGILSEILTSLEKLPVGKQKARQFRLSGGGSIQPISALIMRLIQASAGKVDDAKDESRSQVMQSLQDNGTPASTDIAKRPRYTIRTEDHGAIEHAVAAQELGDLAQKLFDGAYRYAHYVVNFIVRRALKSTKTGDTPYRNLLDLFVEDFTTCLDSPDWPAAELLLRLTMYLMFNQVDGEKNSAPARNMALELLGVMAASISRLRSHVRKTASSFEGSDSDELGRWLADVSLTILEGNMPLEKILRWDGPYRIVVEFLQDRLNEDGHLYSAVSYLVTDWGSQIGSGYESLLDDDSPERPSEIGKTAYRLRNMIEDSKWLSREWRFKSVAPNHAKLSHAILLLRSNFCTAFRSILNILMGSMTTDQATVRSRSLKSVNQVLETDPTILDGDSVFVDLILQCSSDPSPQVRDSALGLIGKCISMRPRLEERMTPTVIQRFIDSGVGVRKRAMKLAKDIYLGNENKAVRSSIANGLLHRMQDPDEGVRELARQMIEEIWISPFYKEDDSVSFKQSLTDHVALMVQTAKQGNTALILDKVFQTILAPESKMCEANTRVCTKLVANMFDLVDNPESNDPSEPSGKDALQVLMIFAKADPKLFTFEQIRLLKSHIASVSTSEDLVVSRAVVVIYRRVLPQVSSIHSQFLSEIRTHLMPATAKITRTLLDDVMACIWIISGLLHNTEAVARLISSSLAGIQKIRSILAKGLDQKTTRQFDRYSLIVGMGGKHCQLDSHKDLFQSKFPNWKGDSVSKLMVDVICPFANSVQSVDIRRPALDAIGLVCQSNPRNFVTENVISVFEQVFNEQTVILESMILRSFREFLFAEEQRSNQSNPNAAKEKKDLKVMGSTSFDDVASATTQRFLTAITRITLATQDDHAFLAVEILASINRQGLVHPKETGVTLITLETCPVTRISELAYHEHRALHEKYESVLEREYAKAVQSAFLYQRDVVHDSRGATEAPFTSKLHLLAEILKISKAKNRVRFLDKLVSQLEFEPSELDVSQQLPHHVAYSRFLLENFAFFEYVSIGDLQSVVLALEKLVTGTGAGIAQIMESEIFQVRMDQDTAAAQNPGEGETAIALAVPESINMQRFRQLTAGSMILSAAWEVRTFLRRLYGLSSHRREAKTKGAPKDLTKAPVRVPGVTGDKFWDDISSIMSGLDMPERMMQQCKAFVDLMNVDSEVKIGEDDKEDELDADGEPQTPEAADDDDEAAHDARGRKRKAANTPGGRKKRARSSSRPRQRGRPKKSQPTETVGVTVEDDDF